MHQSINANVQVPLAAIHGRTQKEPLRLAFSSTLYPFHHFDWPVHRTLFHNSTSFILNVFVNRSQDHLFLKSTRCLHLVVMDALRLWTWSCLLTVLESIRSDYLSVYFGKPTTFDIPQRFLLFRNSLICSSLYLFRQLHLNLQQIQLQVLLEPFWTSLWALGVNMPLSPTHLFYYWFFSTNIMQSLSCCEEVLSTPPMKSNSQYSLAAVQRYRLLNVFDRG